MKLTLFANWDKPSNVFALTTMRHGGISQSPYQTNNLALHVDDNPQHVSINRNRLIEQYNLPSTPIWLDQTHTNICIDVDHDINRLGDAAITKKAATVLAILTADCVPIVLCNQTGTQIAAIHAGWKGLLNGVIQSTLECFSESGSIIAWVGPAICSTCYVINTEIKQQFIDTYTYAGDCFSNSSEKIQFNLALMAEKILNHYGVNAVFQSNVCNHEQINDYYSYRHCAQTGRMATLIWFI